MAAKPKLTEPLSDSKPEGIGELEARIEQLAGRLSLVTAASQKNCGNCSYWRQTPSNAAFGQCMLSGKALSAPMMTLDLARCSKWEPR